LRIALISDIHANLPALEAVIADARASEAQQYICAGDVVGFGPHPKECIDLVMAMCQVVVSGNHDRALGAGEDCRCTPRLAGLARVAEDHARSLLGPEDISWLRGLGHETGLYLSGRELFIVHGSPSDPLYNGINADTDPARLSMEFMTIDSDFIILGHTHRQMVIRGAVEGATLINPGTVGFPLDGDPRAAYSLLDTEEGTVYPRRVPYDPEPTVADMGFCPPADLEIVSHILRNGSLP
jgi:predicted phosphodiesterase